MGLTELHTNDADARALRSREAGKVHRREAILVAARFEWSSRKGRFHRTLRD